MRQGVIGFEGRGLQAVAETLLAGPGELDESPGTWHDPAFSLEGHRGWIARGWQGLGSVQGAYARVFGMALAQYQRSLDDMVAACPVLPARFNVASRWVRIPAEDARTLILLCEGRQPEGWESRTRKRPGECQGVVYVPAIGTLTVSSRSGMEGEPERNGLCSSLAELRFGRSRHVGTSYLDDCLVREGHGWRVKCAAMALSEGFKGVASVPGFALEGCLCVCTGHRKHGAYEEHEGFRVVQASRWGQRTYTGEDLRGLWDTGRRQRGDERGRLVTIRGERYVFASPFLVYDTHPTPAQGALA